MLMHLSRFYGADRLPLAKGGSGGVFAPATAEIFRHTARSLMMWGGFPNPPGFVKEGTSGLGNPLHGFLLSTTRPQSRLVLFGDPLLRET